jgi:putative FmdB family regulatory protein
MPTYEYACSACGIVEAFQSMREDPLTVCPNCKKRKVHRLVSLSAGVIFKGSGFWETDYNRPDQEKRAKAAKPKDGDKPAAAPETPAAKPADGDKPVTAKPETKAAPKKSDPPPAKS